MSTEEMTARLGELIREKLLTRSPKGMLYVEYEDCTCLVNDEEGYMDRYEFSEGCGAGEDSLPHEALYLYLLMFNEHPSLEENDFQVAKDMIGKLEKL